MYVFQGRETMEKRLIIKMNNSYECNEHNSLTETFKLLVWLV